MDKEKVGQRVDVYLLAYLKDKGYSYISRSFLKNNWERDFLLVNGKSMKPSYKIREGDNLEVSEENILNAYEVVDLDNIVSQNGELEIIFEDKNILVLNKQKDISIHPGIGNSTNTVANFVRGYLERKGEFDKKVSRAGVVHRLDKAVSGLVVFAKNKETQLYLQNQFQERNVNKVYYAKLGGKVFPKNLEEYLPVQSMSMQDELQNLEKNKFNCDDSWYKASGYISRSKKNRMKMQFSPFDSNAGKKSVTFLKPLNKNELLIKIETGRMHQIRATLAYLGTYILGDSLYESSAGGEIPKNIELSSILLSFVNVDGKELVFKLVK